MAGLPHRMRRSHRRWRRADPVGYAEWLARRGRTSRGTLRYFWTRVRWWFGRVPDVCLVERAGAYRIQIAGRTPLLTPTWEMYGNDPCAYCGASMQSLDHIVPRSSGGSNRWDNLAASCKSCNNAKGSMRLLWFLCGEWRRREQKRGQFTTRKPPTLRYSLGAKLSAAIARHRN